MSFHQKIVRNCRNPHKGLRINTSARALHSSHRSCFEPFVPKEELTELQQQIYDGVLSNPRKVDVIKTINKLKYYNRLEEVEKVYSLYGCMFHEIYEMDLTHKESIGILKSLTPEELK